LGRNELGEEMEGTFVADARKGGKEYDCFGEERMEKDG